MRTQDKRTRDAWLWMSVCTTRERARPRECCLKMHFFPKFFIPKWKVHLILLMHRKFESKISLFYLSLLLFSSMKYAIVTYTRPTGNQLANFECWWSQLSKEIWRFPVALLGQKLLLKKLCDCDIFKKYHAVSILRENIDISVRFRLSHSLIMSTALQPSLT